MAPGQVPPPHSRCDGQVEIERLGFNSQFLAGLRLQIHSGIASCVVSGSLTITTAALQRRRYRISYADLIAVACLADNEGR